MTVTRARVLRQGSACARGGGVQHKWRKEEKDPAYGDAPAFFARYCIVPLEWWTNETTLENDHAHVHLKGKLAPFTFFCRCTSVQSKNPSLAYVFL